MTTQTKVKKVQTLVEKGMKVGEALKKVKLPTGTYYDAMRKASGKPKRNKKKKKTVGEIATALNTTAQTNETPKYMGTVKLVFPNGIEVPVSMDKLLGFLTGAGL